MAHTNVSLYIIHCNIYFCNYGFMKVNNFRKDASDVLVFRNFRDPITSNLIILSLKISLYRIKTLRNISKNDLFLMNLNLHQRNSTS